MSKESGPSRNSSGGLLKSLRYGSGMLVDGVLAVTPHWAGAVDIMAVRQRDGTIQSSPFYVRFGKYQSWRWNRQVLVKVNGQLMNFTLELGSFGSAFFAHEQEQEVVSNDGDGSGRDQEMDAIHQGMMSPVAAYESNYMSMVAASSPELPTNALMQPSHMHPPSQSQPNLPPMVSQERRMYQHALNGMHDSGSSSSSSDRRPQATSHAELASVSADAHSPGLHAVIPEGSCDASSVQQSLHSPSASLLASGPGPGAVGGDRNGDSVSRSEVVARRLPDVGSSASIADVFVSGAECDDEADSAAIVDSHAISSTAVSQPATPDWHALDRSCAGTNLTTAGPSLATAAGTSFETVTTASEEFLLDSQRLPEDLKPVAEELDTAEVQHVGGSLPPQTMDKAVGAEVHAVQPGTVGTHALHSHPVPPTYASHAAESRTHATPAVPGNVVDGATVCGMDEPEQAQQQQQQQITFGSNEGNHRSAMSSSKSVATLGGESACSESEVVVPTKPLQREGVDVQFSVQAAGPVHVHFSTWVRPVRLSFSATQLAAIRTSLDHNRSGAAPRDALAANGAACGAPQGGVLHRNSLIFHPNVHGSQQPLSPTMLGPHALLANNERHVSFPNWTASDAHGNASTEKDREEDTTLRADSPCARRMRMCAEAMHGQEAQGLEVSSSGGNVATRMTADADALRLAVAEEHGQEVESGGPHDAYQDITPEVELATCAHLLVPDMPASAVAQLFEDHRVRATDVADQGVACMQLENLAVRVGDSVFRYSDAQPLLLAMLTFGGSVKQWQNLVPEEVFELPPKPLPPQPKKMERRRTWFASIFFGASSQEASKEVLTGAEHGLLQDDLQRATLSTHGSADGSVEEERFSSNAEEMQRAAGELELGDEHLEQHSLGDIEGPAEQPPEKRRRTVKVHSTHPTSKQLEAMAEHLQLGQNTVEFISGNQCVQSFIHLFNWNIRLVVSDIDGTITRSDVLGHVLPPFGVDWSHPGVTRLFSNIAANGYQFVYLSSRSIAQSGITRAFLESLKQQEHGLPNGPVIISPHGIIPSLYREMILKRPQEFKMAALQGIRSLFPSDWNPFFCGFGNRITDEDSYQHVGVPEHRIFTINPSGKVRQLSEPESSERFDSLSKIDEQVDLLFPVTETARLRLFAQQVSNLSRHSQASTDSVALAAAAAVAATAPPPAAAPGSSSPPAPAAGDAALGATMTTTAASTASDDADAPLSGSGNPEAGAGDAAGSATPSPSHSPPIPIPPRHTLESLRSLEGMQRFMSTSSAFGVDISVSSSPPMAYSRGVPAVDVDAREEFSDSMYWKMDGVFVSAELEGLLTDAEQQRASGTSPGPSSSGKKYGWGRR